MATVLDTLVTKLQFKGDTAELARTERRLQTFRGRVGTATAAIGRQAAKIARAGVIVGAAVTGAAFKQGRDVARSQIRQQTQLGETAEAVARTGAVIKEVSRESAVDLARVEDALFNVKSAVPGIDEAIALRIVERASKASAIELGEVNELAGIGAQAWRFYGKEADEVFDIIQKTVELGRIPDTAALSRTIGPLIALGAQAGLPFEELFTSVAGLSAQLPVSEAVNAIENVARQLYAPTPESVTILEQIFGPDPLRGLRESITQHGFIGTLRTMADALGDDTVAFRKLVGTSEGLTFALDVSGKQATVYDGILNDLVGSAGSLNTAWDIYANSSLYDADRATNEMKIAMSDLYQDALVPVLKVFGELPPKIQQITVGLLAASVASQLLGGIGIGSMLKGAVLLIPRLLSLVGRLLIVRVASLASTVSTLNFAAAIRAVGRAFLFLWSKVFLPLAAIALITAGILWLINNWDRATAAVERFIDAYRNIPVVGGLQRFGADTAGFIKDQIVEPIRNATAGFGVGGTGFDLGSGQFVPLAAGDRSVQDNRTITVAEGAIVVNAAEGQSEREIGQNVGLALRDQLEALAFSFDSGITR